MCAWSKLSNTTKISYLCQKNPARILWVNQQIHTLQHCERRFPLKADFISIFGGILTFSSDGSFPSAPVWSGAEEAIHHRHTCRTSTSLAANAPQRETHTYSKAHVLKRGLCPPAKYASTPVGGGGGESYSWEQKHPAGCWCASRLRWLDRTYFPFIGTYFKLFKVEEICLWCRIFYVKWATRSSSMSVNSVLGLLSLFQLITGICTNHHQRDVSMSQVKYELCYHQKASLC